MKLYKSKKPFFSVITVVKNDERNIEKTIKSILNQNFKNFEYLIIDGKSVDNTLVNIKKFKKKISYITSSKDKGIYFAMNKGAKVAKGDVVVFVNSGDKLRRNALSIVKKKFQEKKGISFVFGTVLRHYTKDTILKYGFSEKKLFYNFDFATSHSVGFFLKRKIFKKLGFFKTIYKYSADYDLYFRMIAIHKELGSYTKKKDIIGEVASGGFSSRISFINHLLEETKIRLDNKQNLFFVYLIFVNAIFKYFLKKLF